MSAEKNGKEQFKTLLLAFIMLAITFYFIHKNIPFWCFKVVHEQATGTIIDVETVNKTGGVWVTYQFVSPITGKERRRTRYMKHPFSLGDTITILFGKHFPNYVEIKELKESPNLFRTGLPIVISFFCFLLFILAFLGKVDLNTFMK